MDLQKPGDIKARFGLHQLIPASHFAKKFGAFVKKAMEEDLLVVKDNEPKVAVVEIGRYEELKTLEAVRSELTDMRLILESILAISDAASGETKVYSFDEVLAAKGISLDELDD